MTRLRAWWSRPYQNRSVSERRRYTMSTVRIPTPLRKLTGDQRVVQASGATLVDLVEDLERRFPGIKARIVDGDGRVHSFVNIFVDDQDVRFLQGLATPLGEEAEVAIVPAMAGRSEEHTSELQSPV